MHQESVHTFINCSAMNGVLGIQVTGEVLRLSAPNMLRSQVDLLLVIHTFCMQ